MVNKAFIAVISGVSAILIVVGLVNYSQQNDYTDSHSIISDFNYDTGVITIDHYGDLVSGALDDVDYRIDESNRAKVKQELQRAQRDVVTHQQLESGALRVWYEGDDCEDVLLNDRLKSVLETP